MVPHAAAVQLLHRAVGYALGRTDGVTGPCLARSTPCAGWDLATLLDHLADSLAVLQAAAASGAGCPQPVEPGVAGLRARAGLMLATWSATGTGDRLLAVGGAGLPASTVALAGAVEVAVHGWDVGRACGRPAPIPPALALDLLKVSRRLVTGGARPGQFAEPVPVSPWAPPCDRLVAFLGRSPRG